jgi:hypothetical protein
VYHNEDISDDENNLAAPTGIGTYGTRSELQSECGKFEMFPGYVGCRRQ